LNVDGISRYQRYMMYNDANDSSSIKCFEMQYIKDCNIKIINKNKEVFLIDENNYNKENFWSEIFTNWELDLFYILDKYLNNEKQFLNVGASGYDNGLVSLYSSRYSNYVVTLEMNCDNEYISNLSNLFKLNYSDVNIDIENNFMALNKITEKYNLHNISIINMNLNGLEENVLKEYYDYCKSKKIPLLVKFNYNKWEDKNLTRFLFLNSYQREKIFNHPECYLLFRD
jgi:hypothetical protein